MSHTLVVCLGEKLDNILDQCDDTDRWIAYDYENYGYEGGGEAIRCDKEGKLWHMSLGHCSCYGPLEHSWHSIGRDWFDSEHVAHSPCSGIDLFNVARGLILGNT